ncbi:MAG: formylmethanofuran dehydrogenase subunit B [Candidatus Thorarchaeota archaeon]|nr:MAG: formylmethanofuran dehydrogenase subunit B [Candidatus Thorarchaeota archaeon]
MTEGTHENIVCVFCGCLCDDLQLEVQNNIITTNENGCAISKAKFLNHADDRLEGPAIRENGASKPVTLKEAIAKAVDIIANSKRLLVYGLSSTENDAHREAYKIAEEAGGVVDNTSSVCHGPTILGTQESGETVAALGEVRHRSDLVIYWGSNPQFAHPRHMTLHTRAAGEFIKDPKTERKIWVVDIRKTISAGVADRYIRIEPGTDLEVISALRALVRGKELDVDKVGGLSVSDLKEIAEVMKGAKYGVLFFGLGLTQSKGRHRNIDAAIRLIQDLNSYTKWSMMPMRGHYNVAGANKTSTWQTGYPYAVDYARGYPRYQPGEFTAVDMLVRGEADVLLNIAADPAAHFPRKALKHMGNISIINLDPKQNMTSLIAEVNVPTAIAGIECDGAAVRMDGLPLYLKKVVDPPENVLPDRDILRMIYDGLRRAKK